MSCSDDKIRCRGALHNAVHGFDKIAGEAKIAPYVDIAEIKLAVV